MPVEISQVTTADLKRCIHLEHLAFSANPDTAAIQKLLFPEPPPGDSDSARAKELTELLHGDPNTLIIKAVDTSLSGDDALVGWAKWHVYPEGMPSAAPRQWGAGCNAEACDLFFGEIDQMKNRLMTGKLCICEFGP
jgi:hypothetical protein